MIEIKNLKTSVEDKKILNGLNLKLIKVKFMQLWAQMALEKVLYPMLYPVKRVMMYQERFYLRKNLLDLNTEERAQSGIFLAFQYPIEIPGYLQIIF